MPRGGKREGAGRKPGSATRKSQKIADLAAAQGITPLEVMLEVMRDHYAKKRFPEAAAVAKDAAPYIHPRLSAVTCNVNHDDNEADAALEDELERLVAERAGAGANASSAQGRPRPAHEGNGHGPGSVAGGPPGVDG